MGTWKCCQLSQKFSFVSMISMTATFFLVEIIVGYLTNSMALVADSFHMLSDVVSLFVGFIALRYSKLGKQNGRYTFGWARAEVLGALVNAVFLVALCFSIFVEAVKRMIIPEEIENPKLVLVVGTIGLVVNVIGLFLFHNHGHSHGGHGHSHGGGGDSHGHSHNNKQNDSKKPSNSSTPIHAVADVNNETKIVIAAKADHPLLDNAVVYEMENLEGNDADPSNSASQLNMRGVYLHVLGDALGSVIVMISALIIMFTDGVWTLYVDPTMSIIMVLIILKTSLPLLKESSMILMQTVPTHIKIQEIQDRLVERIPGVLSIHEFHIWQLAGNRIIASAHVRCQTLADYMAIANQLKEFFHNEGIHSTTIQPEFMEDHPEALEDIPMDLIVDKCILECKKDCVERTCCGTMTKQDDHDASDDSGADLPRLLSASPTPDEENIA